jgi:protein phosphatase
VTLRLRFAALSDVGRVRRDNQDSGYAGPHLLAVADGVGGAARGDVASTAAIQQLRNLDQGDFGTPDNDAAERLAGAIHLAHSRIADLVADDSELDGTSTTATAVLFDGAMIHVAHVGDSRAYLLRAGQLIPLTKDHTFVQSLVDEGRISEDEARVHPHRNLILRAVDGVHEPEPDMSSRQVQAGDRLLICSDGCCGVLDDASMAELLAGEPLEHVPGALVGAALHAGSSDNVTVVVGELVDDEAGEDEVPPSVTVGAAGGESRPATSWIARRRRADEDETDPEVLRYAPRPPRRFLALRRIMLLVIVLALIAAAGVGGYEWTQSRYYVGVSAGKIAIYRGVNWQLPLVDLDHVESVSNMPAASLGQNDQAQLNDGIPMTSLAAAQSKVRALIQRACAQNKPAKPVKPAPPKTKARSRATGSATPSPSPSATTSPTSTLPPECGAA